MGIEQFEAERGRKVAEIRTLPRRLAVARTAAIKRRRKRQRKFIADTVPVRAAAITTPGKALLAQFGRRIIGKIPGLRNLVPGSAARIAAGERGLGFAAAGPRGLAIRPGSALAPRIAPIAKTVARVGAIGGAFAVGEEIVSRTLRGSFGERGIAGSGPRRQQVARGGGLSVGGEIPPSHQVVRTWQTFPGGPIFARLADGHIAVQKKDGTIKHFRPYRPVVIPRRWNARSMSRVATALKRQRKTATKIMQITGGMPKGRK